MTAIWFEEGMRLTGRLIGHEFDKTDNIQLAVIRCLDVCSNGFSDTVIRRVPNRKVFVQLDGYKS